MFGDIILWIKEQIKNKVLRTWIKQNLLCVHDYKFHAPGRMYYECTKCGRRKYE